MVTDAKTQRVYKNSEVDIFFAFGSIFLFKTTNGDRYIRVYRTATEAKIMENQFRLLKKSENEDMDILVPASYEQ